MTRALALATLLLLTGLLGACATQPAAPPDKHQVAEELLTRLKGLLEGERLFSPEAVASALNVRLEKDARPTEGFGWYRIVGYLTLGTDPIRGLMYYTRNHPSRNAASLQVDFDTSVACLEKDTADQLLGKGERSSVYRNFRTPEARRSFEAGKKTAHDKYIYALDAEKTRTIVLSFGFQECAGGAMAEYKKKAP